MTTKSKILYGGLRALGRELAKEEWQEAKYTILLDENTFQHCLPLLISQVEALQEAEFIEVPVGEECKSLEVAAQVWQTLMEGEADRNAVVVNLGGGCVCDLGGYVAASYKRGIRYINVPTTLLSMVDAAIGGKTAINFGGVKNSIGHFYPSALTVIDPAFLATLPQEELLNGRMEMVKTAAVTDPALFQQLLTDYRLSITAIKEVARIKARVVKADPYDHSIRKILNFGHTFGHAIEVYRNVPHGIAVAIGMKAAMYLSVKKTGLPEEIYKAYSQWLKKQLVSINSHLLSFNLKEIESMLPLMRQDKKNASGTIRCVLLQDLGAAMIDVEVSDNEIRDAMLRLGQ
ncbi:MAG: 3-dehydroquinate synthase [Bacteroidales bacterium]|nr:3-dehydroquinate synthase [Bacteroidales bacterium]